MLHELTTALEHLQRLRKDNPNADGEQRKLFIKLAASKATATTGAVPHLPDNTDSLPHAVQYEIYHSALKRIGRGNDYLKLLNELEKDDIANRAIELRNEYRATASASAGGGEAPEPISGAEWQMIRRLALAEWFIDRENIPYPRKFGEPGEHLRGAERAIIKANKLAEYKTALARKINYDLDLRIEALAFINYAIITVGREGYPVEAKRPLAMIAVAEAIARAYGLDVFPVKEESVRLVLVDKELKRNGLESENDAQFERLEKPLLGDEPEEAE